MSDKDVFAANIVGSVFGCEIKGVAVGTDDGGIFVAFGTVDGCPQRGGFGRVLIRRLQGG